MVASNRWRRQHVTTAAAVGGFCWSNGFIADMTGNFWSGKINWKLICRSTRQWAAIDSTKKGRFEKGERMKQRYKGIERKRWKERKILKGGIWDERRKERGGGGGGEDCGLHPRSRSHNTNLSMRKEREAKKRLNEMRMRLNPKPKPKSKPILNRESQQVKVWDAQTQAMRHAVPPFFCVWRFLFASPCDLPSFSFYRTLRVNG